MTTVNLYGSTYLVATATTEGLNDIPVIKIGVMCDGEWIQDLVQVQEYEEFSEVEHGRYEVSVFNTPGKRNSPIVIHINEMRNENPKDVDDLTELERAKFEKYLSRNFSKIWNDCKAQDGFRKDPFSEDDDDDETSEM